MKSICVVAKFFKRPQNSIVNVAQKMMCYYFTKNNFIENKPFIPKSIVKGINCKDFTTTTTTTSSSSSSNNNNGNDDDAENQIQAQLLLTIKAKITRWFFADANTEMEDRETPMELNDGFTMENMIAFIDSVNHAISLLVGIRFAEMENM